VKSGLKKKGWKGEMGGKREEGVKKKKESEREAKQWKRKHRKGIKLSSTNRIAPFSFSVSETTLPLGQLFYINTTLFIHTKGTVRLITNHHIHNNYV
jgi:hypothetical protein